MLGSNSSGKKSVERLNQKPTAPVSLSTPNDQTTAPSTPSTKTFDVVAMLSYIAATAIEFGLMCGVSKLFDFKLLPWLNNRTAVFGVQPASVVVAGFMALCSLRSRIFSPLDNRRPKGVRSDPVFKSRKRPSWQPAPKVFPIIWSTITLLRVASAVMIFNHVGKLASAPILTFLAHLSIGDTWNTINNVENRLGTAAMGVLFVVSSAYLAAYRYYQVLPRAAAVFAPSCLWLSVATVLVFTIWQINKEDFGFPSFFPSKEEGPPSKWKLPFSL